MIPATNAAALDAMAASRCQKHGKRTRAQPDAQRLSSIQGSANGSLVSAAKWFEIPTTERTGVRAYFPVATILYARDVIKSLAWATIHAASVIDKPSIGVRYRDEAIEHAIQTIEKMELTAFSPREWNIEQEDFRREYLNNSDVWAVVAQIRADYHILYAYSQIDSGLSNVIIDPSGHGPLGTLWDTARPSWFLPTGVPLFLYVSNDTWHSIGYGYYLNNGEIHSAFEEELCSNVVEMRWILKRSATPADFFQQNFPDENGFFARFRLRCDPALAIDVNNVTLIALYRSGEVRSIWADLILEEEYFMVTLDDPTVLIDPGIEFPSVNIPSFCASVMFFCVQTENENDQTSGR